MSEGRSGRPAASSERPHHGQPVLRAGAEPEDARAAAVLVHGRGGSARGMLALADQIAVTGVRFVAPRAAGGSWYPHGFMEPLDRNEPWLSSALELLDRTVSDLRKESDRGEEDASLRRIVLVGFSQGACLALEYAARRGRRFGGVAGLSGGLIGPPDREWDYAGALEGTPAFLGCSDRDPHIPETRVRESARRLEELGARVTTKIYTGLGHTVNRDELLQVREMLEEASAT